MSDVIVGASADQPAKAAPTTSQRLVFIDWMRGFVMVLMVIDHASLMFNAGRVSSDSVGFYDGSPLPLGQFLTRWVTHLCAPTFLFLAGTSLAVSVSRKRARGETEQQIDRDMLIRGALIVGLEFAFTMAVLAQRVVIQVLYAIGMSMLLMVPLRRLSPRVLLALGLGWFAGGELLTGLLWTPSEGFPSVPVALSVAMSLSDSAVIMYPAVPWLAMMLLGWSFGAWFNDVRGETAVVQRGLLLGGLGSLLVFGLVRGLNAYGNLFLLRQDNSLTQWLHVSKYPPSLAYASLELGLMMLCLAGFLALAQRWRSPNPNGPLLVFGQTALFFYLLHFAMVRFGRELLGLFGVGKQGLGMAYAIALLVLFLAYPLCRAYRGYKRAHPKSVLRFI